VRVCRVLVYDGGGGMLLAPTCEGGTYLWG
jgi:hypothetical protein